jgi:hypothetical protein
VRFWLLQVIYNKKFLIQIHFKFRFTLKSQPAEKLSQFGYRFYFLLNHLRFSKQSYIPIFKLNFSNFKNTQFDIFRYLWSGLLVFIGIYLNLYSKNQTSWNIFFKTYILNPKLVGFKKMFQTKKLVIDV